MIFFDLLGTLASFDFKDFSEKQALNAMLRELGFATNLGALNIEEF